MRPLWSSTTLRITNHRGRRFDQSARRSWGAASACRCCVPSCGAPSRFRTPDTIGLGPVPVSGVVRLVLELGFFASATAALAHLGLVKPAITFGAAVAIRYLLSYDRVRWLVTDIDLQTAR
jgi:hypothetical protein